MLIIVVTMFVVLFAFLAGGLWIGWTLAVTGTILLALFRDIPLDKLVAQYAWNILTTQELLALPLFILMGEILFRTRLSQSLFNGLAPWVSVAVPAGVLALVALAALVPALRAILTAYDGWYQPIYMAEENTDPARTLPLAIIGGTLLVVALYLLINFAFLHVLSLPVLAAALTRWRA